MRGISKSLVSLLGPHTRDYRQALRAKGSSALLPFLGGHPWECWWRGHRRRWARRVTPLASKVSHFNFSLFSCHVHGCLSLFESKINSLECLWNRGFWICNAYESAEALGSRASFLHMKSYFNETKKKKKRQRETWESVGIRAGYCVTEIFHFRHKLHTSGMGQKRQRDSGGLKK